MNFSGTGISTIDKQFIIFDHAEDKINFRIDKKVIILYNAPDNRRIC